MKSHRRKKALFVKLGVITLVVFALLLSLLLTLRALKPQIETVASSALGMEVRVNGAIGVTLFRHFGLSLADVHVQNEGTDVVRIERMRIGLQVVSLARRELQMIQVGLVKPLFSIVRHKNGMFNFEKPTAAAWGKLSAVKEITVAEGNLVYTDETSGKIVKAGEVDLNLRNFSSGGTDGRGLLRNISFTGNGTIKKLEAGDVTLTNLAADIEAKNGVLAANPVSMEIFGGTGKGALQMNATGPSPRFRLTYTLDGVRVEELLRDRSSEKGVRKIMEGPLDLSADLTAEGKSIDEVKRSLSGNVSLIGEDLVLHSFDLDTLIPKYEQSQNFNLVDAGAFLLAGPFGPALTKGYDFASLYGETQGGRGVVRKLVSVWRVENGVADATDVALVSKRHRLAMKGRLNLVNERFVDVTVAILDKRGCALYSEKVHGSFRKPQIEKASILKSIAGSLLNPLEDALKFIRGEKCTVFYSGSLAQP